MHEVREKLQAEALEILRTKRRLILNWGTGVGKSRVAINAMNDILSCKQNAKFLLMVQETPHKQNWINEMIEAVDMNRTGEILTHTTIDCYASLKKHEDTQWDLIVFDEGHHLRSPLRQSIIKSMQASRVLVLTATASDNNDGDDMLETLNYTFGEFESITINPVRQPTKDDVVVNTINWLIDIKNGRFINTDGQFSNKINGTLQDILITSKPQPFYGITLMNNSGEKNIVYVPKKLSIAILASLASLKKPSDLPLTINISSNGEWPQYDLTFGKIKVRWNKDVTDNYPKDNNLKIDYLDGIAGEIKNRITKYSI